MVWILHGNARITEVGSGALMHVDVRHCLRSQSSWCSCAHIARHAPSEVIYFSKHQVSGSPNIQQLQMGACAALSTRFWSPLLCSQVGGRLRCLGSNQRLKARFGQGYQLEVWEIARSWLMSLCIPLYPFVMLMVLNGVNSFAKFECGRCAWMARRIWKVSYWSTSSSLDFFSRSFEHPKKP